MKHEYRKLQIWIRARTLNKVVYEVAGRFPNREKFGLFSQITRASVSVVSNIAEGSGYESNAMFLKFLKIAMGSLCEVETQLYLAFDVGYIDETTLEGLIVESDQLKRMIISFMKRLK